MKKFNYVVAHTWDSDPGALNCYMYYNNQVHYGTQEDAEWFLAYVKDRYPNENWKIYKIEVNNDV